MYQPYVLMLGLLRYNFFRMDRSAVTEKRVENSPAESYTCKCFCKMTLKEKYDYTYRRMKMKYDKGYGSGNYIWMSEYDRFCEIYFYGDMDPDFGMNFHCWCKWKMKNYVPKVSKKKLSCVEYLNSEYDMHQRCDAVVNDAYYQHVIDDVNNC